MNLLALATWLTLAGTGTPHLQTPRAPAEAEGICYDGRFCHGEEIPGMRDQWMCFDQGGLSWWHTRALNCSVRGR